MAKTTKPVCTFMWLKLNHENRSTVVTDTSRTRFMAFWGTFWSPSLGPKVRRPSQCTSMTKELSCSFWYMKINPQIDGLFLHFCSPCCGSRVKRPSKCASMAKRLLNHKNRCTGLWDSSEQALALFRVSALVGILLWWEGKATKLVYIYGFGISDRPSSYWNIA